MIDTVIVVVQVKAESPLAGKVGIGDVVLQIDGDDTSKHTHADLVKYLASKTDTSKVTTTSATHHFTIRDDNNRAFVRPTEIWFGVGSEEREVERMPHDARRPHRRRRDSLTLPPSPASPSFRCVCWCGARGQVLRLRAPIRTVVAPAGPLGIVFADHDDGHGHVVEVKDGPLRHEVPSSVVVNS